MSKNLIARIAVAAVAIPIILWISYQGGWWLVCMLLVFANLAMVEYLRAEGCGPKEIAFWAALVSVSGAVGVNFVIHWAFDGSHRHLLILQLTTHSVGLAAIGSFFLVTAMQFAISRRSPAELFSRHSRLLWGVAYLAMLYPFVYSVSVCRENIDGGDLLLFLFGVLWVGDTAAMFVGKYLGKHKLAPTVSPNKTVEGFLGGIAGAIVIGVIMYYWKLSSLGMANVVILSIGCSVFGQLGDLVESMWKRSLGIKDSSALIPGHGGVLDRFDSLLFAAPFMYVYLMFVA